MLAIAGGKGGVGKTTTTLGLATALPGCPLVVDADRDMPNLHALAAVNREPGLDAALRDAAAVSTSAGSSSADSLPDSATPLGQHCPEHGCRVLPAPDGDAPRTDQLLNRLTALHRRVADSDPGTEPGWREDSEKAAGSDVRAPILIDTPAGASVDAAAPLQAADGVLLVSTPCAPALRDAAKTASMARAVGTPVVGVVLTQAVARPPGAEELLGCSIVGCVPTVSGRPLESRRVQERYRIVATELRESCHAAVL